MASKAPRPWSKTAPDGPWDYLVIGSGMGGMTCAALLSELGKKVLVLEQHYVPGGFTHAFKRKAYQWDVGVHAVGEVTSASMSGRLLKRLTRGRLRWASLGSVYDEFHYHDGLRIAFPDNPEAFQDTLCQAFPSEGKAIEHYLAKVRAAARDLKPHFLASTLPEPFDRVADRLFAKRARQHLNQRTSEVIEGLTQDPRLRKVLTSQWGYYGSIPGRSSFAIQALVTKHFLWGGYYPVGGAGEIARGLLQTVADAGGWTRICCDVSEILIRKGRASGVRLESGEEIYARHVVSAAGVHATVRRLLPPDIARQPWAREVAALPPAPAHLCLYLGFRGDIRQAGCSAANKWFYRSYSFQDETWQVNHKAPLGEAPVLYCSFPSLKDPSHDPGPKQHHTGEIVTFAPWQAFAPWRARRWKHRGADYDDFKQALSEQLLQQLLEHLPGLKPMVDYFELSTPLSTDTFCRPVAGSIYGLEPTPERFACRHLRPRSPVPGLLFAGSEVATVGVMGAMMGGVLAALAAEPRRTTMFLRRHAL